MHAFNGLDKVKKKPPIILGHEVIGINLQKNKYCAINPIISCSKCEYCKKYGTFMFQTFDDWNDQSKKKWWLCRIFIYS